MKRVVEPELISLLSSLLLYFQGTGPFSEWVCCSGLGCETILCSSIRFLKRMRQVKAEKIFLLFVWFIALFWRHQVPQSLLWVCCWDSKHWRQLWLHYILGSGSWRGWNKLTKEINRNWRSSLTNECKSSLVFGLLLRIWRQWSIFERVCSSRLECGTLETILTPLYSWIRFLKTMKQVEMEKVEIE